MSRDGHGAPGLVLASSSPRRLDLLRTIGLQPVVRPADVDETPVPGEKPWDLVARLAAAKARRIAADPIVGSTSLVVAADTVIDLDGQIFGKPLDRADGARMLRLLAGRSHRVLTGVAVAGLRSDHPEPPTENPVEVSAETEPQVEPEVELEVEVQLEVQVEVEVASTDVWIRPCSEADIDWYLSTGEPMGKAGAYAIQGRGSLLVDRIDGSHQNVVGLPLPVVAELVSRFGWELREL